MTHKPDPRALARRNRAKPTTAPKLPMVNQPPAVAQVFSTPELVESILVHLDMRTLLTTAQRISRTFLAIITASPRLQRTLFFRPSLPSSMPFTANPLLTWAFPCLMPVFTAPVIGVYDIRLPPSSLFVPAGNYGRGAVEENEMLPMTDIRYDGRRHLAFTRRGASWRRMLLCQPPAMRVARVETWPEYWKMVDFSATGGLRMGVLFDEVFTMNWAPRRSCYGSRCRFSCHGVPAMVLWRVPGSRLGEGEELVLRDASGEPYCEGVPGWVAEVDLVVGENWREFQNRRAMPCVHPAPRDGMPPRCFLSQQEYWDSAHADWRCKSRWKPVGGKDYLLLCDEDPTIASR
ncbi:hypothetical protein QBC39DRAFT_434056 [Podospora conica]|nr:hypothetical protein QBC39DRAFT_434056 [Schizothecium conicum]